MKALVRFSVATFALLASTMNIYMLVYMYSKEDAGIRMQISSAPVRMQRPLVEEAETMLEVDFPDDSNGNISEVTMSWSGILAFFPDLQDVREDELEPILLTSRSRVRKKLMIGIPVAERKIDYSIATLSSLFSKMDSAHRSDVVFVVMFPTNNSQFIRNKTEEMKANFSKEITDGLLEIIAVAPIWYKTDIKEITPTFNDSQSRMYWRTKQNIDYIYIMTYARQRCHYYMQLEDDVTAAADYTRVIFNYIALKTGTDWFVMGFTPMGFIGKLFSAKNLKYMTYAIALYYRFKPVDWILEDVLRSRYCSLEKSWKECALETNARRLNCGTSQFQHVGKISSLDGKIQKIRDAQFSKGLAQGKRSNPPATVQSSMSASSLHNPQRGYDRNVAMWLHTPKQGDYISITFEKQVNITGMMFLSGLPPAPMDKLGPEASITIISGSKAWRLGEFSQAGDFLFRSNGIAVNEIYINVTANMTHWIVIDHIVIDGNIIPNSNTTAN